MAISEGRDSDDRDGDTSPVEMEAPTGDFLSSSRTADPKAVEDVLYSDVRFTAKLRQQQLINPQIGINVLLDRLKRSIASARVRTITTLYVLRNLIITGIRRFPKEAIQSRRRSRAGFEEA